LDKFPEAFERFEEVVNVRRIKSFRQLKLAFAEWAGEKWIPTSRQLQALAEEARKFGLAEERRVIPFLWRREIVMVRGKRQSRIRDLRSGRFIRKL
jgi:hypothetical protein